VSPAASLARHILTSALLASALVALRTAGAQVPEGAQASDSTERRDSASPPGPAAPRLVAGRVLRPGAARMRPVAGVWVVLHRVGSDTAAPIDSARSGRDGSYRFRYRPSGSEDAIYFVSADFAGIAYFSPPLRAAAVTGDDAQLTVFDTTSAPIPLNVRGRHLVVSAPAADGSREIIEVYELSNDTTLTAIAGDTGATWTAFLPPAAGDFRLGQSDVSPEAVRVRDGRVYAVAPFAPGIKQLSFAYRLPAASFPLSIPLERSADVLEVLVEDAGGDVEGAALVSVDPVTVDGRNFKRYLARNSPAAGVVRVSVTAAPRMSRRSLYVSLLAIAVGAAMLVALGASFARRTPRAAIAPAPPTASRGDAELLARAIADLDATLEARAGLTPDDRARHVAQRAELKRRLAAALAAGRRDA